ncbi:MAG: aminopeptidase [Proteobacteria bacterium]|nr:aminopeptidase [Pseudomonadota bacterium]
MLSLILATTLSLLLAGCTNIAYYAQAVEGHLRLMAATRPIPDLVSDAATDPELRQQLAQTSAIREFASRELGLPNNGSYRAYADLRRPYAVWNVFAAPEFSVDPQQWCLMFVGCINYRGYYDKNDADRYAADLRQAGADTYVRGVPAYSTLGYFNDPVLNTFLRFGDQEVARIIFHELAHQLVYAQGDSTFNESFATAVENEGMRRWLAQSMPERLRDFETQQERKAQFARLVADHRDKLRAIYASTLAPDAMRRAKAEVLAGMRQTYAELKMRWGGYAGYDPWFSQPLNNAALGSITLYTQWVPAFRALLEREEGNLPGFYRRVAELARLPKSERAAALNLLLPDRMAFR